MTISPESKKISLVILGITAILTSRSMFALFDDPEGPNLLVVFVMAVILYVPSVALYVLNFLSTITGQKRLLLSILLQLLIAIGFYFALG